MSERRIEELLGQERLSPTEREELNERLRRDPAALDVVADQLEVDALLRWHHGAVGARPVPARRARAWVWAIAAAVVLALVPLLWSTWRAPEIDKSWQVAATGGAAEFTVLDPHRVRLTRGEIRVSTTAETVRPFSIETPSGRATTRRGSLLVGHHHTNGGTMDTSLTRVLVIAGAVSLVNALGAVEARAGGLLIAPQGEAPSAVVARSNNDFGFDLYRELVATTDSGAGNLFFSPYSVATALAMTAEGARGATEAEMRAAMRLADVTGHLGDSPQRLPLEWAKIHTGFARLQRLFDTDAHEAERRTLEVQLERLRGAAEQLESRRRAAREARDHDAVLAANRALRDTRRQITALNDRIKGYELQIANSVWSDRGFALAPEFVETVQSAYDTGAVVAADFRGDPAGEVERINAWVDEQTRHRIPELLAKDSIDRDTRLVLLNAIWFAGEWSTPFDPANTREREFRLASGEAVTAPMMEERGYATAKYAAFTRDGEPFATPNAFASGEPEYPEAGGFQMLELPYRGGDLAMLVLLPDDPAGLPALEARLTAANLARWTEALAARSVSVTLPKFQAETGAELRPALEALGMESAFDSSRADFSGMVADDGGRGPLYIGKVVHKAFVDVNEEGTEAAAATAVTTLRSGSRKFVPEFTADRPFAYLIRDLRTGTVLFCGRQTAF